jgi:Sigma-70 region 2
LAEDEAIERFTALYDDYYSRVYAYAVSRFGSQLADEVVSEVFLIAWQRIFDVPEPALPWLLTVARNTGLSQFRAAARQQSIGSSAGIRLTARGVLLSAATHVPSAPASGKFWKTTTISGVLMAAGTSAHPCNMFIPTRSTQWAPRRSGVREWTVSRTLGLVPATPADAAAWHAAGSPNSWHYVKATVTTSASRPSARWQVSDGTVGLVEGDEPGLTPAQFRAMPASPRALLARLRHYAQATWCGSHHSWGCSTVDQIVWSEAVNLLQDPVTPAVRAATFHVMAGLPGVRLLGKMRDPMGRPGYGVGSGASAPGDIAVIDPATGSLLAVEGKGSAVFNTQGYFGPSYPGQVGRYEVVVSDAWTNMAPVLPPRSTWIGPNGQRG